MSCDITDVELFSQEERFVIKSFNDKIIEKNKIYNQSLPLAELRIRAAMSLREERLLKILYCVFRKHYGSFINKSIPYSVLSLKTLLKKMSYKPSYWSNTIVNSQSSLNLVKLPVFDDIKDEIRRSCLIHKGTEAGLKKLCDNCIVKLKRLGLLNAPLNIDILEVLKINGTRRKKKKCINHTTENEYSNSLCLNCFRTFIKVKSLKNCI